MRKKALITGLTGQDGSYLAEQLLDKGYEVHGMIRRTSSYVRQRIDHLTMDPNIKNKTLFLHYGDMTDGSNISRLVEKIMPDEVYNLAAQSVAEDCLCPMMLANKIQYKSLGDLWSFVSAKGKEPRIEHIDDVEVEVIDMPNNKQIRALGYWNGTGTWFSIKQVSRHRYKGQVARLTQKFGSVTVTPNHSILDIQQRVKMPIENPWLLNVRKLNYEADRVINKVVLPKSRISVLQDGWIGEKERGRIGLIKEELDDSVENQTLKDFCFFLGAFISEGHTSFNVANETYTVGISNQDKDWLEKVETALLRFFIGNTCFVRHQKDGYEDVWELQIKSRALYRVLRHWCGKKSTNKKLPDWVFQLSKEHQQILNTALIEGDGCVENRKTSEGSVQYTTASYELACQLSLLWTMIGMDYTVYFEENDHAGAWHLRQCQSYQPNQGNRRIEWIDYDGWVYDISVDEVENFAIGVGNIVVHNSHVKISFDVPEYSAQVDGIGTIRILDALRELCPTAKYYQASTSELYGLVQETPQRETTPFYPRSPYAAAKLYAYWITKNYREAYGMFACNGILFNHETLTYGMPLILKDQEEKIDILPIGDIARFHTGIVFNLEDRSYQEGKPIRNIEVWDKDGWTKVKWVSGYPHKEDEDKNIISVNSRNYSYTATGSHVAILEDNKGKQTQDLSIGDKTKTISYPETINKDDMSLEKAEFLGMLVGDGNLNGDNPRFTNKDQKIKERFISLWTAFTGDTEYSYLDTRSGFTGDEIGQVVCENRQKIKFDIYTNDTSVFGHKLKKVPKEILNSSPEIMEAFLVGYNVCDGLKKNKCTYQFKNFKTSSPTLAAGLLFLVSKVTGQEYNISLEESYKYGKQQIYYSINLLTTTDNKAKEDIVNDLLSNGHSQRKICRETGISRTFIRKIQNGGYAEEHHLKKINNEIKKLISVDNYRGWLFDLETESGTFHAGIGQGVVHNSERRGENFVTKKITVAAARIAKGKQKKVSLGNLSAMRDWGYAPDYCIDLDVPVLTTSGWKFHDQIEIGEEIINFDHKENRLSCDTVNRIVRPESDGTRIILKGRGVYLRVTPGHRVYYQTKSRLSKGGWSEYKVDTAETIYKKLKDKAIRTKYDYRLCHFQDYNKTDIDIPDSKLYLIGALLAKGDIKRTDSGRTETVSISQSLIANEDCFRKIEMCSKNLQLEYYKRIRNDGVVEWILNTEYSKKVLEWFDSPNVHIMPRWIYSVSARQANIIFEALMDCDGSWENKTYTSKRPLLAADFQSIAHIAGYRTTQTRQLGDGQWYVGVISKRKKHQYIQEVEKTKENNKETWCIETSNGTIITRDNGCISISGNCDAMYRMLQADKPQDIVIATGEQHSVEEFCEAAFRHAGIELRFEGEGLDRKGIDKKGIVRVDVNPEYFRPTEVQTLLGDPSLAKKVLGWEPKTKFDELVRIMVEHDLKEA